MASANIIMKINAFSFYILDSFKKAVSTFGGLDIVINNAGVMKDDVWELEIAINCVSKDFIRIIEFGNAFRCL